MTPGQHLGTVVLRGPPLRQYAAMHGEVDHPWTLAADLAAFAEFDGDQQAEWLDKLGQHNPEYLASLPDGAAIVAEPVVSGLLQLWIDHGYPVQPVMDEWTDGWSEVFAVYYSDVPRAEWLVRCQQAALRNVVHMPGATMVQ